MLKIDCAKIYKAQYENYPPKGSRPKGLFKYKEKEKYDKDLENYYNRANELRNKSKELKDEHRDKLHALSRISYEKRDIAIDAANRHIRRHPKQYKESAVFESIDLI